MKVAVLSDIHANYAALKSVLKHADSKGANQIWLLGDLIGYTSHPRECIQVISKFYSKDKLRWVAGNHERILQDVLGFQEILKLDPHITSQGLYDAVKTHMESLCLPQPSERALLSMSLNIRSMNGFMQTSEAAWYFGEIKARLKANSLDFELGGRHWALMHGSLSQVDEYVYPWSPDSVIFKTMLEEPSLLESGPFCICYGHTHIPVLLNISEDRKVQIIDFKYGDPIKLSSFGSIINPGSVGLPSDYDPRSSYAMIDIDDESDRGDATITFYRLEYDVGNIIRRMGREEYPITLQDHLNSLEPLPREGSGNVPKWFEEQYRERKNLPGDTK